MRHVTFLALVAAVVLPWVTPVQAAATGADVLPRVQHIVVIYQEN